MRPAAPNRPARRSAKGQAMAIFALVSVLLFVVAGLAVDAGTSYLTSNQLERAAAAAALAGVAYLPGDKPDAINAALVEAARDGFTNTGAGGTSCTASNSPCVLTSFPQTNEMKVQISVSVSTIFLRLVGFGNHTVVRSETAQYLPPISLGQPGSQQGADISGLGVTGYFEREEGWGNPRSEGDAFDPTPYQNSNACGPSGGDSCSAAGSPDYHAISPADQTETPDATLEYQGGSNYLIDLPPGASADVQVYNPAFAPDTCGGGNTAPPYCYHENDGSFGGSGSVCTEYSAMAYTLFSVSTLSSRLADTKVGQEIFYPYNESNTPTNYFYYKPGLNGGSCPSQTTVSGTNPTYHQWVSVLNYTPTNATDPENFNAASGGAPASYTNRFNGTISNPAGATADKYYRLEVDSEQWNGWPSCKATVGPCTTPDSTIGNGGNGFSDAHKGYAVRLVSPGTSTCTSCGSVSAMDDMTVFTPVNGSTNPEFAIPLFSIDPTAYAGETIDVDLFDVGDVGGGPAYVGLREPNGVTFATANSVTDLGADLGGSAPPSSGANVTTLGTWPGSGGGSCGACYQTAGSGGGAIYQGQWVQIQLQVPASFTGPGGVACTTTGTSNCYWSLVYDVSSNAVAGDTFSVEVGFDGSPDHLLP
jgi:Flp pilus assembly protein TadG